MSSFVVSYHCNGCGANETVCVRFREYGEEVTAWLEGVVRPAVAGNHFRNSPGCIDATCDLKIPMPPGTRSVGGPVQQ